MARATSTIDVLIPAYNAEDTIEEAIASIQIQTVTDIRIIVVNDGSKDGTGDILARMAASDPRLLVITRPNGGIVDALNDGLAVCTAEFVARHDADDIALPERFAQQLQYLQTHPDCVAVGANAWHIDASGKRTGTRTRFSGDVAGDPDWAHSVEPYILHPMLMIRREALQAVGGYRYVFHAEDTDLYWRLMSKGRLHNLPAVLGHYRVHDKSVSSQSVINGRVAATNSQLAAISEQRRRKGIQDISFDQSILKEYNKAGTLSAILELASRQLSPAEVDYLKISTSAKLMHLISYRPYALDSEDCSYIKNSIYNIEYPLSVKNRKYISRNNSLAVIMLMKRRRPREALLMLNGKVAAGVVRHVAGAVLRRLGIARHAE